VDNGAHDSNTLVIEPTEPASQLRTSRFTPLGLAIATPKRANRLSSTAWFAGTQKERKFDSSPTCQTKSVPGLAKFAKVSAREFVGSTCFAAGAASVAW